MRDRHSSDDDKCTCCGAIDEFESSVTVSMTAAAWPVALMAAGALLALGGVLELSFDEISLFAVPAVTACLLQCRRYQECARCGVRVPEERLGRTVVEP